MQIINEGSFQLYLKGKPFSDCSTLVIISIRPGNKGLRQTLILMNIRKESLLT